jgi:hypothetical protein
MVRDVEATVTLKRGARLREAIALDAHGYEKRRLRPKRRGNDRIVEMPPDALYVLVR